MNARRLRRLCVSLALFMILAVPSVRGNGEMRLS